MTTFGKPWSVADLEKQMKKRPEQRVAGKPQNLTEMPAIEPEPSKLAIVPQNIKLSFTGQIRGGKNNMIITRTGLHFPKKEWAKWRDEKVMEIKMQLPKGWQPISEPVDVVLNYAAGDKRRRDFPAIVDAIFHVLEKAGVVTDDTLIWISKSTREYRKDSPGALLTFLENKNLHENS